MRVYKAKFYCAIVKVKQRHQRAVEQILAHRKPKVQLETDEDRWLNLFIGNSDLNPIQLTSLPQRT
jgi:hypothetical protein